jgi:hypothetical protein
MRLFVVTPDMHRVHHSILRRETNSNFGFNLPWWDFLFGTYRAQPAEGHEQMTLGLEDVRDEAKAERLHWILALPFLSRGPANAPPHARVTARKSRRTSGAGCPLAAADRAARR